MKALSWCYICISPLSRIVSFLIDPRISDFSKRAWRCPEEISRETWLTPLDLGDNDVIANDIMQLEGCSRSLSKPDFSPSSNSVGWRNASFSMVIWRARRGKTDSLRSHAAATVARVSLIRSKNRVCPIGVEIVARRNEISRLLDFRWLRLPSPPSCARKQRGWPGRQAGRSQESCLAKQSTDCDLREKGDRRRRKLGNYFSCLPGTPVVIWIHPVSGACLECRIRDGNA